MDLRDGGVRDGREWSLLTGTPLVETTAVPLRVEAVFALPFHGGCWSGTLLDGLAAGTRGIDIGVELPFHCEGAFVGQNKNKYSLAKLKWFHKEAEHSN